MVENGDYIPICKTEVINDNLNPKWRPVCLGGHKFGSKVSFSYLGLTFDATIIDFGYGIEISINVCKRGKYRKKEKKNRYKLNYTNKFVNTLLYSKILFLTFFLTRQDIYLGLKFFNTCRIIHY